MRQLLTAIDDLLFEAWDLGANIVLVWTRVGDEYRFLAVRHYAILEPFHTDSAGEGVADAAAFIDGVFSGQRRVALPEFERICDRLGKTAHVIRKVFADTEHPADALVTQLVARYSVSLVPRRSSGAAGCRRFFAAHAAGAGGNAQQHQLFGEFGLPPVVVE